MPHAPPKVPEIAHPAGAGFGEVPVKPAPSKVRKVSSCHTGILNTVTVAVAVLVGSLVAAAVTVRVEPAVADAPPALPRPAVLPRTTAGRPLAAWTEKDLQLILGRSVVPFHREITDTARRLLAEAPLVLVITLRSFGAMPLPFEKCRKYPRPQAAVGSHPGLTPPGLAELAGSILKSCRWWPELNWPQAESACLPEELAGNPRVRALGLSLCRGLYLDERTGQRKSSAKSVVRVLRTFFNLLDQELDRVARVRLDRARPKKPAPKIPSPVIKAAQLQGRE